MDGLRKLFRGFETAMAASAFAEAGEAETAVELLNADKKDERIEAPGPAGIEAPGPAGFAADAAGGK